MDHLYRFHADRPGAFFEVQLLLNGNDKDIMVSVRPQGDQGLEDLFMGQPQPVCRMNSVNKVIGHFIRLAGEGNIFPFQNAHGIGFCICLFLCHKSSRDPPVRADRHNYHTTNRGRFLRKSDKIRRIPRPTCRLKSGYKNFAGSGICNMTSLLLQ